MNEKTNNIINKKSKKEDIYPKRKPEDIITTDPRYANHKKWNNDRWAWEFLRRYTKFIEDCDNIKGRNINKQQEKIAEKYALNRFKHYADTDKPYPWFVNKVILTWQNEEMENGEETIKVNKGEMLILFYVEQTLYTNFELENQIKSAAKKLKSYQESLKNNQNKSKDVKKPTRKRRITTSDNYLRHLMVIDWRKEGRAWSEIAGDIFAEKIEIDKKIRGGTFTNAEINQKYYKTLAASLQKPADYRKIVSGTREKTLTERLRANHKNKKAVAEKAAAEAEAKEKARIANEDGAKSKEASHTNAETANNDQGSL